MVGPDGTIYLSRTQNNAAVDFSANIDPSGCAYLGSYHTHPFTSTNDFMLNGFSGGKGSQQYGDREAFPWHRSHGRTPPFPPYVGFLGTAEGLFISYTLPEESERLLSPLGNASPGGGRRP